MRNMLNITEATSLGLHSMTMLANYEKPISVNHIAENLGASKHHLSKVLRNLVVAGFVTSVKGPLGGFILTKLQLQTSFLQILEVFEGKFVPANCLFDKKPCIKGKCILGDLLCSLNQEFLDYFNNTKIIDFKEKK